MCRTFQNLLSHFWMVASCSSTDKQINHNGCAILFLFFFCHLMWTDSKCRSRQDAPCLKPNSTFHIFLTIYNMFPFIVWQLCTWRCLMHLTSFDITWQYLTCVLSENQTNTSVVFFLTATIWYYLHLLHPGAAGVVSCSINGTVRYGQVMSGCSLLLLLFHQRGGQEIDT